LVATARAAGARVDSNLTFDVAPLSNGITEEISAARRRSLAAAAVGGLALLLSLIGIGAVAAQTVINRTHEIGVRMALGARSPDAVALVVRSTLAPVAIGLVFGTIGAALVTRVLSSQLYGLSALDPAAFAGGVLMLFLASCGASWIPARRAARVDPIIALRAE
jgi:putative ABC transport system permease protein